MEFSAQQETASTIDAAYGHCWQIARSHYENFTVGSWLLPRRLRRHIAAIYAFARTADDMADEGAINAPERLARLDAWEHQLAECYRGRRLHPIFVALGDTADRFGLPMDPFRQLLHAFRADAEFKPFETFDALLEYCRCSADPVGHLILYLFGYRDSGRQQLADQICTGLQLTNFWQDIAIDGAKGRLYVPLEDLARFGCSADDIKAGGCSPAVRELMRFEVERARGMLTRGLELAAHVDRRLAREVCLFAWGGLAILRAIEAVNYDVLTRRPTLSKQAKLGLVLRALATRRISPRRTRTPIPEALPILDDGYLSIRRHKTVATPTDEPAVPNPSCPQSLGGRPSDMEIDSRPDIAGMTTGAGSSALQAERKTSPSFEREEGYGRTLRKAYAYCQAVTRRSSSNFYYAFRLLSPERRQALYAVYAFCRFIDDIADDKDRREPAALLARWREELELVYGGAPTHPIGCALADTAQRFALPQEYFLELIRGVEMDLTRQRYAIFDELYHYCYRVASTVGLLCIEIFGYQRPSARDYAVDLGIAFQLTNILRDVLEDARRGRIYLPLEDLHRFDCAEAELLAGRYSPRFAALMAFECSRARAYYRRARSALAPEDRSSLAAAEAMCLIYKRLLDRIEARHFDVFGPKVTLPRYEKVTLALAAWGRSQLALLTS
jgi:phytoene synthase